MSAIWFLMLPWSVALFGALALVLGSGVTWAAVRVR